MYPLRIQIFKHSRLSFEVLQFIYFKIKRNIYGFCFNTFSLKTFLLLLIKRKATKLQNAWILPFNFVIKFLQKWTIMREFTLTSFSLFPLKINTGNKSFRDKIRTCIANLKYFRWQRTRNFIFNFNKSH